jgi:Sec-independent protein secretion pathway component TatC
VIFWFQAFAFKFNCVPLLLGPGEYFFTTVKVAGYCGLLIGAPVVLYEVGLCTS